MPRTKVQLWAISNTAFSTRFLIKVWSKYDLNTCEMRTELYFWGKCHHQTLGVPLSFSGIYQLCGGPLSVRFKVQDHPLSTLKLKYIVHPHILLDAVNICEVYGQDRALRRLLALGRDGFDSCLTRWTWETRREKAPSFWRLRTADARGNCIWTACDGNGDAKGSCHSIKRVRPALNCPGVMTERNGLSSELLVKSCKVWANASKTVPSPLDFTK